MNTTRKLLQLIKASVKCKPDVGPVSTHEYLTTCINPSSLLQQPLTRAAELEGLPLLQHT